MNFYPWHSEIYQQIIHSFEKGRGHHALLFKTELGLGTELLIQSIAHWLICQERKPVEPCQQCKSCLLWQSSTHPDFHCIDSIDGKEIGIDQIRELSTKLQQFSQQGGNIVVYFPQAHRLTEAAANALLKTLEEPRENVYFLLQVPLQSAMLATIQSRCQTWLLQLPSMEQTLDWLHSQLPEHSLDEIKIALSICHSRPLNAKNCLEKGDLILRKTFLQTFWRFYKSRDVWLLLEIFDKNNSERAQEQLEWLASFFSDALKAKMDIVIDWVNPDLHAGILPFSQDLSSTNLLRGYQLIQQTQQDLKQINGVNQELLLADCITQLAVLLDK